MNDGNTEFEMGDSESGTVGGGRSVAGFVSEETTRIPPDVSLRRVAEVLRVWQKIEQANH